MTDHVKPGDLIRNNLRGYPILTVDSYVIVDDHRGVLAQLKGCAWTQKRIRLDRIYDDGREHKDGWSIVR